MHLVDVQHGLLGATGVVGGNLPMALGNALAARQRGSDAVTVVFFGDGAVQAGHFHESVNLAALWELPVVFVCENNGMAEFTSRDEHSRVALVSDVVAPYGFARTNVDGGDVAAVWREFGKFLAAARRGNGPMLLECATHRRRGHYEGDQQQYRDPLEEEQWRQHDPVTRFAEHLLETGWLDAERAASVEEAARAEVEAAVEFARASPFPSPELAASLVYA